MVYSVFSSCWLFLPHSGSLCHHPPRVLVRNLRHFLRQIDSPSLWLVPQTQLAGSSYLVALTCISLLGQSALNLEGRKAYRMF